MNEDGLVIINLFGDTRHWYYNLKRQKYKENGCSRCLWVWISQTSHVVLSCLVLWELLWD